MMDTSSIATLEAAFHPNAIAVAGASENPLSFGYHYVHHLINYGYPGHIYPINPSKQVILGLKAYPNLNSVPEPVDYVICCLPASKVLGLLPQCAAKGVKVVHLLVAGLSETGRHEAKALENSILQEAKRLNIRLVGPNCMGIYYPRGGIAHGYDLSKEAGKIGAFFQSGGSSHLLVRLGELRGLGFSKVISYGNALDLNESDFLEYFAHDEETKIIAAYIEGVKDGRKFLKVLGAVARIKPVIIIKGGRGIAGAKACSSHTAVIAGSDIIWKTALKKTGVILVQDLNELVDFLVAFSFLPPIQGNRAMVIGSGGGSAVMAADACEEAGLMMPPLPLEIRKQLKMKIPELWDWVGNPLDVSITGAASVTPDQLAIETLIMIAASPHFDFIIAEIADGNPIPTEAFSFMIRNEAEQIIKLHQQQLKPVVAVVGVGEITPHRTEGKRWRVLAEQRTRLIAANIPTYSTIAEAARAVRQVIDYWRTAANR